MLFISIDLILSRGMSWSWSHDSWI